MCSSDLVTVAAEVVVVVVKLVAEDMAVVAEEEEAMGVRIYDYYFYEMHWIPLFMLLFFTLDRWFWWWRGRW